MVRMDQEVKYYISIPMRGHANLNEPLAREMAAKIEQRGDIAVVPHDIPVYDHDGPCPEANDYDVSGSEHNGLCYLRADLIEMLTCDIVLMGPRWSHSRGCTAEYNTARLLGITIQYWSDHVIEAS